MTRGMLCAGVLLSGLGSAAVAQTPPPPAPQVAPLVPATATTSIEQDKRGAGTPAQQTQRTSAGTRPGATPLPMNIKIQDEGIRLPACTSESREGEACKK